jgi:hypothetical protein
MFGSLRVEARMLVEGNVVCGVLIAEDAAASSTVMSAVEE